MKLSSALVKRTLDEFEAQAIPDNHPVLPELNRIFGEHTFFLDGNGLHIVEPASDAKEDAGKVIKLASWNDPNRTSLAPHPPETTGVVVPFGREKPDKTSG
jgi:hypothetical protein